MEPEPGAAPPTALVTGGTGKLGRPIVARLVQAGFRVHATGRRDGDVTTRDGARALVAACVEEHGSLDLLVNAAADGFWPKPVEEIDEADWAAAFDTVAKGSFFVTQAAAPHLRGSALGLVVMIEDVGAYMAWPSFGAHCAAKAAQAMLTRVFARALAPDVRVCGIAPGSVVVEPELAKRRARENLLGRVGSGEDVADAVLYLVGARFVTGTTIFVDGGRMLAPPPGGAN